MRETSEASRAALVTGGTAGIGLRVAQVLREQGGRRVGKLDVLVLAANLEGTILAPQALLPVLKAARGSVINFSSGLVRRPVAAMALEPRTSFPSWSRRRRKGG